MSDSRSRIADDEEEYESLCKEFGVKEELVETPIGLMTDAYGEHSRLLKEAYKNSWTKGEFDKKWKQSRDEKARKKKEEKQKIAAAKAKLTPEELSLLNLND